MERSILLQLARDSIQEVYEAKRSINKQELLTQHPLLNEKIATTVNIYLNDKLKGSYGSSDATKTLIEDIIYNAKKAAFEDKNSQPLTTNEYIHCEVELILNTPDGLMSQRDASLADSKELTHPFE